MDWANTRIDLILDRPFIEFEIFPNPHPRGRLTLITHQSIPQSPRVLKNCNNFNYRYVYAQTLHSFASSEGCQCRVLPHWITLCG